MSTTQTLNAKGDDMPARTTAQPPATQIAFATTVAAESAPDALVLTVPPGADGDAAWQGPLAEVDAALGGALRNALRDARFDGKVGSTLALSTLGQLPARRIVATGLPESGASTTDIRRAYGAALTAARKAGAKTVASPAPGSDAASYRAAVEGLLLAGYDFRGYKASRGDDEGLTSWTFLAAETDSARKGVADGFTMASGIYLARDLVAEPGQAIYPETLAAVARQMATDNELDYREYDEKQLVEMGATAIYDVGKGSAHLPRMLHLTYKPAGESKGTIAFVGKGITFDTGGYNLKPTGAIETMKTDMAGAAAVIGAMRAIAGLDLPFTVYGIVASAENMASGTAFRPGDVLSTMNGKTIEITSTDAEGRLVLADALVYAAREGADEMIDLATLTGAKMIALGSEPVAVFANDDDLARRIVAAGTEAGDLFWHMPLWDALKPQIKSDIADMKNTGGRAGGAITAALLLAEFTEGKPWAHLDIAGACWADTARDDTPKGPTGIGVRALVNYLEAKAAE
jgi:leucyl aminopeptidase